MNVQHKLFRVWHREKSGDAFKFVDSLRVDKDEIYTWVEVALEIENPIKPYKNGDELIIQCNKDVTLLKVVRELKFG